MSTQAIYKSLAVSLFVFVIISFFVSGIRINEIMARTPEYVEIYNPESEFINLSIWHIKDSSTNNPDEITCHNISNCSLLTNSNYFLIIGRNTDINSITAQRITYFYVDDTSIGNGMNDEGDNITFYNSSFSTNFYYNSSEINNSLQFIDSAWQSCTPTPGSANSCQSQQNQTQNQSANETQNTTQQNQTSQANQTQQNQTSTQNQSIATAVLYYSNETSAGKNISVELYAYNLDDATYDVKLAVYDGGSIVSETYNENEVKWKSSTYYINSVFYGAYIKKNFTLRIKDNDFEGEANISVKLRKSGTNSAYIEYSSRINILRTEKAYKSNESIITINPDEDAEEDKSSDEEDAGIIRLNNAESKTEKGSGMGLKAETGSVIFMSQTEKIKKYAIYGFAVFLVLLIIVLLKYRRI